MNPLCVFQQGEIMSFFGYKKNVPYTISGNGVLYVASEKIVSSPNAQKQLAAARVISARLQLVKNSA